MAQAPKPSESKPTTPTKPSAQDIADAFDKHTGSVLFLDQELDESTRKTLLSEFELFAELDAPRGVDSVREATDEELATLEAEGQSKPAAAPKPAEPLTTT